MASIWKHPRSQFFSACFRDADGRQRRISTKTNDRKLAKRMAAEFEKATRHKRSYLQLEKTLRALHEEICGKSSVRKTLRDFSGEWLAERAPSVSRGTQAFYDCAIRKLLAFFADRPEIAVSEVTRGDLVSWRNHVAATVSANTANHDLVAIKTLFKSAREAGLLSEDPAEFVKPIRVERSAGRRPFTIPELQAVLAIADPEWQSMVRIGLYSGGRLADVASLTWGNVDLIRGELRFTAKKTRKATLVPIAGPLRDHLLSLPGVDDPATPLHPKAFAVVARNGTAAALSGEFGRLLVEAGVRPQAERKSGQKRGFSLICFHSLRHSLVSLLKDAGVPQSVVQEFVGHSSTQVNQVYTHVGVEALSKAAEALPVV